MIMFSHDFLLACEISMVRTRDLTLKISSIEAEYIQENKYLKCHL